MYQKNFQPIPVGNIYAIFLFTNNLCCLLHSTLWQALNINSLVLDFFPALLWEEKRDK